MPPQLKTKTTSSTIHTLIFFIGEHGIHDMEHGHHHEHPEDHHAEHGHNAHHDMNHHNHASPAHSRYKRKFFRLISNFFNFGLYVQLRAVNSPILQICYF